MNKFPVDLRILLSKKMPAGVAEVHFDRYCLRAIPSDTTQQGDLVLQFENGYSHAEGGGSHPEEEATNVCRLLSLFLNARYRKLGLRLNNLDIPVRHENSLYPQFRGEMEVSNLADDLKRVQSLDVHTARQFLRASHAYGFALEFIPLDTAFAFFLLVVAVECMSSQDAVVPFAQLDPDRKKAERFVRFVETYLPEAERSADERNSELFNELLKTIYYSHRSGFVHGGKEVSVAALVADRANSSYFKHEVDGKEVRTPGIGWFAGIARGALMGYLRSRETRTESERSTLLAELAMEKTGLRIKAKRDVAKHTAVTLDDLEYR